MVTAPLGEMAPFDTARRRPSFGENASIVHLNQGFERERATTRTNCWVETRRFLVGSNTDSKTIAALRTAIDRGEPFLDDFLAYDSGGEPLRTRVETFPTDDDGRATLFVGFQREFANRDVLDRSL